MSALRSVGLTILAAAAFVTVTMSAAPDHTTAGTPSPAYVACTEEDASAPDQVFPCYWNGGANGAGRTYVLAMPVCTVAQVAISDAFRERGLADPIAGLCDDLESLTGSFA